MSGQDTMKDKKTAETTTASTSTAQGLHGSSLTASDIDAMQKKTAEKKASAVNETTVQLAAGAPVAQSPSTPTPLAGGGSGGAGDPPALQGQGAQSLPPQKKPTTGKKEKETDPENMSLMDHFRELRSRLIIIFLLILAGFFPCYYFSGDIAEFLYQPLIDALPKTSDTSSIIFTGVPEAFFIHMKIGFVAGFFAASPFIFYQVWSFIAPGLYKEERVYIVPVAICSAIFFVCGGLFCYYFVFPNAFKFFMGFSEGPFKAMPSMSEYFSFALQLIFAFGVIFELPLFVFFLSRLGIITAAKMKKFRRYAILISFIVAAILTPPDPISQLLMAFPMVILYELSIFVSIIFEKKPKSKPDEKDSAKA